VNDHRQIQLDGEIKLGAKHGQLLVKVRSLEQIQAQFSDRHDPGIGQGRLPQQGWSAWLPVLGIEWVHATE